MIVTLVKIGNSQGIRLPKSILSQCQIENKINIEIVNGKIILKAVKKPREDWREQMRSMHERGEDTLLMPEQIDSTLEDLQW